MKRITVIIATICMFCLCGCTDYREIDRGYLVTAIGISKKENSTQIHIEAQSSSLADKSLERVILTENGSSTSGAFENLTLQLVKPLYFEQTAVAVFNTQPTDNDIKFLTETLKLNYGVYVVKTDDIKTLFEYNSPSKILGYDIIGLIKNFEKEKKPSGISRLFEAIKYTPNLYTVNIKNDALTLASKGANG